MKRSLACLLLAIGLFAGSVINISRAQVGLPEPSRMARFNTESNKVERSDISEGQDGILTIPVGIRFPDSTVMTSAADTHFQQMTFSLPPGQGQTIALPVSDMPVRIDICARNLIEGNLCHPVVITLLVAMDSDTGKIGMLSPTSPPPLSRFSCDNERAFVFYSMNDDQTAISVGTGNTDYVTTSAVYFTVSMYY